MLRHKAITLLGVTTLAASLIACSSSSNSTPSSAASASGVSTGSVATSGQTLTVGAPAGPRGFDPYNCSSGPEQNVLLAAYDTLLRAAPDGTFQPSLAVADKYLNDTTFTLKLRSDLKFADGSALDATAVKTNLDRATKTLTQITAAFATSVKAVTVVDPTDLTITLSRPNPDLPSILSSCAGMIVSPKLLATPADLATKMDGSGPYTYDAGNSITNSAYTFQHKNTYWNAAAYSYHTVTFKVISDFNAEYNALVSGQIDIAAGTPQELDTAKSAGMASVQGNINFYMVNLLDNAGTKVPALKDVRVRQALNYAIDRAAIVKTFWGATGRPTDQSLSNKAPGYDAALDSAYAYDPIKARSLLAAAGYKGGFTMPVLSTQAFQLDQVLQAVAGYWAKIGVTVQDNVKQIGDWSTAATTTAYPAVISPFTGIPPFTALAQRFSPVSPLNPFHTSDPAFLTALGQAGAATGSGGHAALTAASKQLIDQARYAGIGYDVVIWFYNPKKVTSIEMQQGEAVPHFYNWKPGA